MNNRIEHPILFKPDMVEAILTCISCGTVSRKFPCIKCGWTKFKKRQTRRIIKNQPPKEAVTFRRGLNGLWVAFDKNEHEVDWNKYCPYGIPGEYLWVRETWKIDSFHAGEPVSFMYKDGHTMEEKDEYSCWSDKYEDWYERISIQSTHELQDLNWKQDEEGVYYWGEEESPLKWRSSIHMPRWASNISLINKRVRIERIQDITEEDAEAEGIDNSCPRDLGNFVENKFIPLWDKINANRKDKEGNILPYSWDDNPCVWVTDFGRV